MGHSLITLTDQTHTDGRTSLPLFTVDYAYSPDTGLRDTQRPSHRAYLDTLDGEPIELLLSGPWVDGAGALLIFSAPDESALGQALDQDPFQLTGVITGRTVRRWTPARGPFVGRD